MKLKNGISLIILVITIIIIIILAGAVILSLSQNNPISTANQAAFKSNVAGYNDELSMWITSQYASVGGNYDSSSLNKTGLEAKNEKIIPSMKDSDTAKFEIQSGKLVFVGTDEIEIGWAESVGITATNAIPDTTAPTVSLEKETTTTSSITVKATATDVGGLNTSSYQYSKDNGTTWTEASNAITYTFTELTAGTYNCKVKVVDSAGNIAVSEVISVVVTPYQQAKAAVVEGSTATPLPANSTIDGQNPNYNNPVIPAGFIAVNTDVASWALSSGVPAGWNNGLIIQDASGNQFVWVPVNGTYAKDFTFPSYYGATSSNTSDDTLPSGVTSESAQITVYKGFYIARFEASFDYNGGSIRAKSTKSNGITDSTNWSTTRTSTYNGYLWNYINYTDAKAKSESMDADYGYDTTKIVTGLVTGTQWDTTMKWIQNAGISVIDSTSWGNYNNVTFTYEWPTNGTKAANTSMLLNAGAASRNRAKNIYDLGRKCMGMD